jgi:hypothetical protein
MRIKNTMNYDQNDCTTVFFHNPTFCWHLQHTKNKSWRRCRLYFPGRMHCWWIFDFETDYSAIYCREQKKTGRQNHVNVSSCCMTLIVIYFSFFWHFVDMGIIRQWNFFNLWQSNQISKWIDDQNCLLSTVHFQGWDSWSWHDENEMSK